MVSSRPPTSKSSSPFCNPLVTVPNAPITIGILVTSSIDFSIRQQGQGTYPSFHFIIILLESFSHQCQLMVFHWSLSDSKSPQVSKTRLRILAVLCWAVVWRVSTRPSTSKSSRPFNNPLVIVPIVTFIYNSFFFNSLARSRSLSSFSLSFRFILWSAGTAKSTILQILFFFFFFVDYYGLLFYPGLGDPFVC